MPNSPPITNLSRTILDRPNPTPVQIGADLEDHHGSGCQIQENRKISAPKKRKEKKKSQRIN